MRILPGDQPDVWYEINDLSDRSLIIIRRESVTCCGFLGGDTIQVVSSGSSFAHLLMQYRPVIPFSERGKTSDGRSYEIQERIDTIFSVLREIDTIGTIEPGKNIAQWNDLLSFINRSVWFTGSQDPFRYSLELSGDIQSFLNDTGYQKRLITCLLWWYRNEASPYEQDTTFMISDMKELSYPVHHDLIVRAINLYNHGTYEIAWNI